MKLNLKGWKKIAEEKDHSILRNKDNHELKILHKGLHPATRGQLASLELANGGEVKMANGGSVPEPDKKKANNGSPPEPDKKKAKEMQDSAMESGWQPDRWVANAKAAVGMAEGGRVMLAEGTNEPLQADPITQLINQNAAYIQGNNPGMSLGDAMAQAAVDLSGAQKQRAEADALALQSTPEARHEQAMASLPTTPAEALQVPQPPVEAPVAKAPVATQAAPTQVQAPVAAPVAPAPVTPGSPEAYAQDIAGIQTGMKKEADAIAAKAAADSLILQKHEDTIKEAQTTYQKNFQALMDERQGLINDINEGHIDPNHLVNSMDAGSKIATIIGLIAGGLGGGMTHQENLAAKFLQNQIDADITAQKANLGKKESLLSANLHQFGNLKEAEQMTRIMQADMLANKLQVSAAQATSPVAQARLLQQMNELKLKFEPEAAKMAQRKTIAQMTEAVKADPSKADALIQAVQQSDPAAAHELRSRQVPGYPFAPTPDDAKQAKEVLIRKDNINQNVAEVVSMIEKHGTNEFFGSHNADLDRRLDQIATDMAKLQDPNSVARPGEVELVKKTLASPGIFKRDATALKMMNNFTQEVEHRANIALARHGVGAPTGPAAASPEVKLTPGEQSFVKWARDPKNVGTPDSKRILKKFGLQ